MLYPPISLRIRIGATEHRRQERPEAIAAGAEDSVDLGAFFAFEIVPLNSMIVFQVAKDRFDGGSSLEPVADRSRTLLHMPPIDDRNLASFLSRWQR